MTKVFNVDAMAAIVRTITLDGVNHQVTELTVNDFIALTLEAERIEATGVKRTTSDSMNDTAELAHRYLQTVPVERLRKLTMEQLGAVIQFVRGDLDEEAVRQAEAGKA